MHNLFFIVYTNIMFSGLRLRKDKPMAQKKDSSLYILEYLYSETDDDHSVTAADIIKRLNKKGISLNIRTVAPTIASINEFLEHISCMEIISFIENHKTHYKLIDRPLEYTEIEMLSFALNSVKSLTKKDIINLKTKLYSLLSRYELEKVIPAVSKSKSLADDSGTVSWYLEQINAAINKGLKISLQYNSRDGIKTRTLSPYKLHTSRDGIYILGKCHEHASDLSRFRLDRINKITLLNEKLTPCKNPDELEDMIILSKDMSFGEKGTAVFTFTKHIENVVYDRYGKDIKVTHLPDGRMRTSVDDYLSSTLLGWIFSLGSEIQIEGSKTLLNMMKESVDGWAGRLSE